MMSSEEVARIHSIVDGEESKVYKYHVQIPELWFDMKYTFCPNKTFDEKQLIRMNEIRKVAAFVNQNNATVLFSGLPPECEGWKIELISAPESAYRDIVESLGRMLREQPEIMIHTSSDLGAEILALSKESKEVSDGE